MCDTLCAPPNSTAENVMLFGKSSDRQRNEAQGLEYQPRADHPRDAKIACTYIAIPQARRTHAVLLSRPYWIWGAEMGANEHGVAIGNETVYSKGPAPEEPALIGMDLVRLALERANTAAEAVEVMTALLERYGQGGDCGHLVPHYYNNGFIIADPTAAFVLETVGRDWLVERVTDVRTSSNCYSIGQDVARTSAGLDKLIRDAGWSEDTPIDYAVSIADRAKEAEGTSQQRRARSTSLLRSQEGHLRVANLMTVLRDHGSATQAEWTPHSEFSRGLCMHAGAKISAGQTTGAMISELRRESSVHWITGTAATCISIFKPVLTNSPLPPQGPALTGVFDSRALWWRHERLHRAALMADFPKFLDSIRRERDELEAEFATRVTAVRNGGNAMEQTQVIAECWKEAMIMEDRWFARLDTTVEVNDIPYRTAWLKLNRIAGMDGTPLNDRR